MQLINLSHFNTEYRKRHDIETAIAWNAVKKALTELDRDDLFEYIQSVKITEKYITLMTGKPIVNEELKFHGSKILQNVNVGLQTIKSLDRIGIRLK